MIKKSDAMTDATNTSPATSASPPSSHSTLFWEFAKVGLFTFGGGYAMIPIVEDLCVTRRGWLTAEEMNHTIVIAESTPGPIAVNCATFVGFKQRRWTGALATTAGICLPSFVIIYCIALFFANFLEYPAVVHALAGINVAVSLLVLQAGWKMARQHLTPLGITIAGLALTALILGELRLISLSCPAIMGGAVLISLGHYVISGQARTEDSATSINEDTKPTAATTAPAKTTTAPAETATATAETATAPAETATATAETTTAPAETASASAETATAPATELPAPATEEVSKP